MNGFHIFNIFYQIEKIKPFSQHRLLKEKINTTLETNAYKEDSDH